MVMWHFINMYHAHVTIFKVSKITMPDVNSTRSLIYRELQEYAIQDRNVK